MDAAGSTNDAARAVRTESQQATQFRPGAFGLAWYARARAASARLNLRKVAGVLNPTKPGPGSNTNTEQADWRCVRAESSRQTTCWYTQAMGTDSAHHPPT